MRRRDFLGAAVVGGAGWLAGCAARGRGGVPNGVPDAAPHAPAPGDGLVYVGTYTEGTASGGVYGFRAGAGGWRPLGATDVGPNPSFLAVRPGGDVLYAVNEVERYEGAASGALAAFAIDRATGALAPLGARRATGGGAPCYVSVDPAARYALVANYVGGSVALFPLGADGRLGALGRLDQHAGSGPRRDRQEGPHAHCVLPDPRGGLALAADLGTDRIYAYRLGDSGSALTPAPVPSTALRPGSGPRHLAFHPRLPVVYAVDELALAVSVFRWDGRTGALEELQTVPAAEGAGPAERTAADLHVAASGRFVYATVRGDDVIAAWAADAATGRLTLVDRVPTGGRWPRNFALDPAGRRAYVANQRSDAIVGFAVDERSGRLTPNGERVEVPAPVCVRFA